MALLRCPLTGHQPNEFTLSVGGALCGLLPVKVDRLAAPKPGRPF